MHDLSALNEEYARQLSRRRAEATYGPKVPTVRGRTARRLVASGLHRLADRVDN
jgi:hypothetical protein